MFGVIFSVTLSVTIASLLFLLLKGKLIKRYGFRIIYTMSLIMAIRLIIPYSIQLPDTPKLNITLPWYLPLIWITGVVVCAIYQSGKYIYMKRKIISYSRSVSDESVLKQYEAVKSGLFIDNDIPLIVSAKVSSPMLLGIIKPYIVLPRHIFSDEETEMVLRHELMHYKSKDSFKKLFFAVVAVLQWFNPFIWLLMKEVCRSLECICDEAVTKNADNLYKKNYCYMLLKTGAQNQTPTAIVNNFSTKEMLKMRINNVFESKRKKSGTVLVTSFTACIAVLSGFLCSCTVKTPSDVKEEMSRIEQGIENESNADTKPIDPVISEDKLVPVSEVVSTAQQTIDEWNSKNGIFKFDNCSMLIPQITEFPEYEVKFDVGVETPEKKIAQFRQIEKEVFGKNSFEDDNFTIVSINGDIGYITLDEYIELGDSRAAVANGEENASFQHTYARIWCTKPNYYNYIDESTGYYLIDSKSYVKEYNCFTATEAELSEEYMLPDGKISIAEAMKYAEELSKKHTYNSDDEFEFKASSVRVYDAGNGIYVFEVLVQVYYKDIPVLSMAKNYRGSNMMNYPMTSIVRDVSIVHMLRCNESDMFDLTAVNTSFTPTGNTTQKILSLNQVFELIKDELSNSVVYDVKKIQLGFDTCSNDVFGDTGIKTLPIYNVTLETTSNTINVSIDAVTGHMNTK